MKKVYLINVNSFFDSLKGLLKFKDKPILLHTRFGIHTFFLEKNIYCYLLKKKGELHLVVEKKELKPFRFYFWNPKYNELIESYKPLKLNVGDEITVEYLPS